MQQKVFPLDIFLLQPVLLIEIEQTRVKKGSISVRLAVVLPRFRVLWINLCCFLTVFNNLLVNLGDLIVLLVMKQHFLCVLKGFQLPFTYLDVAC